jgi:hypothetical protein
LATLHAQSMYTRRGVSNSERNNIQDMLEVPSDFLPATKSEAKAYYKSMTTEDLKAVKVFGVSSHQKQKRAREKDRNSPHLSREVADDELSIDETGASAPEDDGEDGVVSGLEQEKNKTLTSSEEGEILCHPVNKLNA